MGLGRGIVDGEPRVQRRSAFVKCRFAMPLVGAAPRGDDNRTRGGASGIGVSLRGAKGKFLNGIGRKVLQEAANIVVGIVAAINGNFIVESGAAAGRNRGDARLRGIGRLDRFGSRREIGDVGKTARGERDVLQILVIHDGLVHRARGV